MQLKAEVPEGTVVVVPEENYFYTDASYYEELTDVIEKVETIPSLAVGETYTLEYEVRIKSDIASGAEISNKVIATCEDTTIESSEIKNKLEEAKIRVTVKDKNLDFKLLQGQTYTYLAIVENLSNETIKNLELELVKDNYIIKRIGNGTTQEIIWTNKEEGLDGIVTIEEMQPNQKLAYLVEGRIAENAEQVSATAKIKDSNGVTHRSNKIINTASKIDAKITLTSPQDKKYIRPGDVIEYNITVENTGDVVENIEIVDNISEYLKIEELYVNGECKAQTVDSSNTKTYMNSITNNLSMPIYTKVGETGMLKIVARVKDLTEDIEAKTITNKAEAQVLTKVKDTSEEVTHILTGTSIENQKNILTGSVWLDSNLNGQKDSEEPALNGIKVILYNTLTNDYVKDSSGNIIEAITDDKGLYTFTKIQNGTYIVLFEYDTNKYEPTIYQKEGVEDSINSKAILKTININGENKTYAVTDTIKLEDNMSNLNLGLKEKLTFDLELNKYITRATVQTSKGTKTYNYDNAKFAKIEIHSKQINGAIVVLEYTIKVKNTGNVAGYVNEIVDYLPNGLTFNSELNADWYISGENLHTKSLQNEVIKPGEEKEVKLILTKTMTETTQGLMNNRAEIYEAYNEYGILDIDSVPNNEKTGEDDLGSADVIIGPSTGVTIMAYIILAIINTGLIFIAIRLMIKNNIIKTKKERR